MEKSFLKTTGFSLIIGSILLIVTMVLHPSGGSIEHNLKIKGILMGSHGLAIFSLPIIGFGFWGLTVALQTKSQISILAFIMSCFGLLAGMLAATINGFSLPLFLTNSLQDSHDTKTVKSILIYGRFINIPMDYIMIVMLSFAIAIWSVIIVRTNQLLKWIGYFGALLVIFGALGILLQFNFANLFGFRIFIFGIATWIILVGYSMVTLKSK